MCVQVSIEARRGCHDPWHDRCCDPPNAGTGNLRAGAINAELFRP